MHFQGGERLRCYAIAFKTYITTLVKGVLKSSSTFRTKFK